MKKMWIIAASVAMLIGLALIAGVFFAIGFNFSKLGTETYVRAEYALEETFSEIEINTSFFDVKIFPVNDDQAPTAYLPYSGKVTHSVTLKEGKLRVVMVDSRVWYEKLFFDGMTDENTTIELYLPYAQYNSLKIKGSSSDVLVDGKNDNGDALLFATARVESGSGDIEFRAGMWGDAAGAAFFTDTGNVVIGGVTETAITVETDTGDIIVLDSDPLTQLSLKTDSGKITIFNTVVSDGLLHIEADSGDVEMRSVRAGDLKLKTSTGDVDMISVLIAGEMRVETDTGEIDVKHSDAGSIYLESDTGDVEMELLTGKMFTVETDTGDVKRPDHDQNGGICRVKTDTGDVEIAVVSK